MDPSLSGLYLPRVCNIFDLVFTLGMTGPISEWAVYLPRVCNICSSFHSRHELTQLRVGCICLEYALYVLVFTLGMSGPITEWAVSALKIHCIFLLLLSA